MICAIIAVLIICRIAVFFFLATSDAESPADEDLVIKKTRHSRRGKRIRIFSTIEETFKKPTDSSIVSDYHTGKAVDTNALKAAIAENEPAFNFVRMAITREHCFATSPTAMDHSDASRQHLRWRA